MRYLMILSVLSVLLTSCDGDFVFGKDKNIEAGWHKDSVFVFQSDSFIDLPEQIKLGVFIRNNTDFPYQNLWLNLHIELPGDSGRSLDTLINHQLMTPDGYWKEGVEGSSLKESVLYFPFAIHRPPMGVYRFEIGHGMRDSILPDIITVGARIEKHERND